MEKRAKKILPTLILLFIVGLGMGFVLSELVERDAGDESEFCKPGLFCLEDKLAYRDLSCGLLVGANEEANSLCENGRLVEDHPLVRTSVGDTKLMIIDTELLDLQEKSFKWNYYPSGELEVQDFLASPRAFSVCGLGGEQEEKKYYLKC